MENSIKKSELHGKKSGKFTCKPLSENVNISDNNENNLKIMSVIEKNLEMCKTHDQVTKRKITGPCISFL